MPTGKNARAHGSMTENGEVSELGLVDDSSGVQLVPVSVHGAGGVVDCMDASQER